MERLIFVFASPKGTFVNAVNFPWTNPYFSLQAGFQLSQPNDSSYTLIGQRIERKQKSEPGIGLFPCRYELKGCDCLCLSFLLSAGQRFAQSWDEVLITKISIKDKC